MLSCGLSLFNIKISDNVALGHKLVLFEGCLSGTVAKLQAPASGCWTFNPVTAGQFFAAFV